MLLRLCGLRQAKIGSFFPNIHLIYRSTRGRLKRFSNTAPFHTGRDDVAEEQGQTGLQENGWEPWPDAKNWTRARTNQVDDKNIVVDDLNATLDAHRTANRIRKFMFSSETATQSYRPMGFLGQKTLQSKIDEGNIKYHKMWRSAPASGQASKSRKDKVDDKNIVFHGLKAAHRTANRIGKFMVSSETATQSSRPLDLSGQKTLQSKINEGNVNSQKVRRSAPASGQHSKSRKDETIGDYIGESPLPNKSWAWDKKRVSADNQSPWLTFVEDSATCGVERLSTEIAAYERYMRLSPGEVKASRDVQEAVDLIATEALPAATVDLIGSYSNGLATANSDMDFRLSFPMYEKDSLERGPSPGRPEARKATLKHLRTLHAAFAASEAFEEAALVRATIPIIRATHARTKIVVDIQVSSTEVPQQLYKETYLAEYPTLRPLYIVLRSALYIRGLGAVFEGGLGSYPILIMIVYALKTFPPSLDKPDVGRQLLSMLNFYATVDTYKKGFSLDPPSMFPKLRKWDARAHIEGRTELVARGITRIGKIDGNRPYLLCLQDPADPMNDLGRNSYNIMLVRKLFRRAYFEIIQSMNQLEADSIKSAQPADRCLLFPLVGANYEDFESRRRNREQDRVVLGKPAQTLAVQRVGVKARCLNVVRWKLAAIGSNRQKSAAIEQHDKGVLFSQFSFVKRG